MFSPLDGVFEDPATGSAAGALGVHLLRTGVIGPGRITMVQGVEPGEGGVFVCDFDQILHFRDTDGDGAADEIKPLVEGFNPNHSQLQVSAPRRGLDNCVYFNNGLDPGEIYPSADPSRKMKVSRSNLRWDPATGKLEMATGNGQFGGCFFLHICIKINFFVIHYAHRNIKFT